MSTARGILRIIGLVILVGMALVPPWRLAQTNPETKATESNSVGYHPLWNPPSAEVAVEADAPPVESRYHVDLVRLGVQLGVVLVLMNGVLLAMRKKA